MSLRSLAAVTLAFILHVSIASAQESGDGWYALGGDSLGVGDPAPKLTVQAFLRGPAIPEFEAGKVYVIEFWKCGCPPCRVAIPHLNELQTKYPAVAFIGVGVITPTADNEEYVKKSGDHMDYRVAVDRVPPGQDPSVAGEMVRGWLEPASYDGVPTAFVIDGKGRIAWIGHPMDLDNDRAGSPLTQVISGTWDLEAAAQRSAPRSPNTAAGNQWLDRLPQNEREAVMAIQKRAHSTSVEIRGNAVTQVDLSRSRVTDSVLADLAGELHKLHRLRELNLCSTEITDAGIKSFRGLAALQYLDLSYTRVTDVGLAELRGWNDLRVLNLRGSQVTDAGLKELGSMKLLHLLNLNLSETHVAGAGLKHLKGLPELHVIDLSHTDITDVALRELQGLEELHGLNLSNTRITDTGISAVKGMELGALWLKNTRVAGPGLEDLSDRVEFLELSGTRVGDAALSGLERFPHLRQINLNGTLVTDAGLVALRGNRGLQVLNLADTRLTDRGLRGLEEMKALETLGLGGTGITDAGLNVLKGLKSLTFLDVARTNVTREGVARLRSALPDLEIAY